MQRAVLPLLLLAALGLAVWWLWTTRLPAPAEQFAATTPTAAAPAATAGGPAAAGGPPSGYRLAGLAVGEPASFAVIELPNGNSQLYRLDSKVPGLGRIVEITEAGATIEGDQGRFTLQLKPAPTPTPDRRRTNGEKSGESTTAPEPPDGRGDKALEPAS
jgi:hypothetical protein